MGPWPGCGLEVFPRSSKLKFKPWDESSGSLIAFDLLSSSLYGWLWFMAEYPHVVGSETSLADALR